MQVERQYEADLPLVPLDESLSEQAFVNLIQNAYDAMGSSGGTLRVKAARTNSAGRDGVEVRIEDTGPGIPPELREQIFNPFVSYQENGSGAWVCRSFQELLTGITAQFASTVTGKRLACRGQASSSFSPRVKTLRLQKHLKDLRFNA